MSSNIDYDTLQDWASSCNVSELATAIEILTGAMKDTAAKAGDLDAIVENAYDTGFDADGLPVAPTVVGGVLVVCGATHGTTRGSHKCRFAVLDDIWVWESPEVLRDDVRHQPSGVRTVTLLAAIPGMKLEMITSKAQRGTHTRTKSEVWKVNRSGVELIEKKGAGKARSHR